MRFINYMCCLLLAFTASGAEMVFTPCDNSNYWRFHPGSEFPGAQGCLLKNDRNGKIELRYDFSKGGKYVSVSPIAGIPVTTTAFRLQLNAAQESMVNYRIIDVSGRTFQGLAQVLKKGIREIEFSCSGPWSGAWGGKETAQPQEPLQEFVVMVTDDSNKKGTIGLESCRLVCEKLPVQKFTGENFNFYACGWKFASKWLNAASGPILEVTADSLGGGNSEVSFDFPEMARNSILRFSLNAQPKHQVFSYMPVMTGGGNINNIYRITFTVEDKSGNSARQMLVLRGRNALDWGMPITSREISASPFGVCVHFSQRTAGWTEYERVLDMIAAAGIKWIRDDCGGEKIGQNEFRLREYELGYLKAAKKRGVNMILCISLSADEELPVMLKRVAAIVRDSKDLVNVYELGNEPNNFGNWIKKYGGTWNGWEGKGKISPWVKAHLKYTNAAADLIKKMRPDATIIGLGACTSTNFHALKLGVTPKLDGVVDHPYSMFGLPPEKVPWSTGLEARDGIKTGDEEGSFAGLVNSYVGQFRQTGITRSLWLTENGFSSFWFSGKNEEGGFYFGVTEEAQACYLMRRLIETLALPVAANCIYDFLDDGSDQYSAEANFGVVRSDFSPKPSYYAIQRMTSLLNGCKLDNGVKITVNKQPLHQGCHHVDVINDKVKFKASNGIKAFGFVNPERPDERTLAVWSALPFCGEFNSRACTMTLKGWKGFSAQPVAVDLITGRSYDVPCKVENDVITLDNLILKNHPIVIKFFRN